MKKMKQLKDREHTIAKIKVSKIKEVFTDGTGGYAHKDKLICIKIDKPTVINSTCFKDTKKGRKELLNYIRDELYLK